MRYLLALFIGTALLSCNFKLWKKQGPAVSESVLYSELPDTTFLPLPELPHPSSLLHLSRIGCGGPCPEWEAHFYPSGTATLVGTLREGLSGAFRADFSMKELDGFMEEAQAIHFFSLPDTIPASGYLNNLPGWKIDLRTDSLHHQVTHSHQGPLSLRRFEQHLEDWVRSIDWERID